jgi:hypothetical protein
MSDPVGRDVRYNTKNGKRGVKPLENGGDVGVLYVAEQTSATGRYVPQNRGGADSGNDFVATIHG